MKANNKSKTRGETLIEVIVAMSVLAVGAMAASTLIISTIRGTSINKNYLVAVNLAREGVEAVRSIRDTNWLKFSYNNAECWDVLDDSSVVDGKCELATKLASTGSDEKYYRAQMNTASSSSPFKWVLEQPLTSGSKFDPSVNTTSRQFYLLEPSEPNNGLYRHTGQEYDEDSTSFYRGIIISKETEAAEHTTAIRVISLVQWFERDEVKEVSAETILANYQQ